MVAAKAEIFRTFPESSGDVELIPQDWSVFVVDLENGTTSSDTETLVDEGGVSSDDDGASSDDSGDASAHVLTKIGSLALAHPISVLVEPDAAAFIARAPSLPLYGHGDSRSEAVEALADEIASLWEDLSDDTEFTDDWDPVRETLTWFFGSSDEE